MKGEGFPYADFGWHIPHAGISSSPLHGPPALTTSERALPPSYITTEGRVEKMEEMEAGLTCSRADQGWIKGGEEGMQQEGIKGEALLGGVK